MPVPLALPIERILIIKLRALGDVVLSTIVTKNLRLAFPDADIDFLTEPPGADVMKGNPYISATVVYDRATMSGLDLIRLVRRHSYDLVIDLFGNPRTALVTRLSGAPNRVGYRFRWRTYAYNHMVEPRGSKVHNTQFNLDALEALGFAIQDRNLYFHVAPADEEYVLHFLTGPNQPAKLRVGINSGGGWYTKRWGLDNFASLADRIIEKFNADVILLWGPGQLPDVEKIRSLMKHKAFVPPATTLSQLGALLRHCSIVVTNDSGPMHLATAVQTPVLGIYGPTNPVLQGPYGEKHMTVRKEGLDCLGCNLTACPIGHPCMLDLSVETVLQGVEQLLKKNAITYET